MRGLHKGGEPLCVAYYHIPNASRCAQLIKVLQYLLDESLDEWIMDQMNARKDKKDLQEEVIFELPL